MFSTLRISDLAWRAASLARLTLICSFFSFLYLMQSFLERRFSGEESAWILAKEKSSERLIVGVLPQPGG